VADGLEKGRDSSRRSGNLRVAPDIEAEGPIGSLANPDPSRNPTTGFRDLPTAAQDERVSGERMVVEGQGYSQSLPYSSRSRAKGLSAPAPCLHVLQSRHRIEGSYQNRCRKALLFSYHVQAKMDPVAAKHVGPAGWSEHRLVSSGLPDPGRSVGSGIVRPHIGLRLHDHPLGQPTVEG
jgi:hypothetical protein